jgi:hypothetical protein
LPPVQLVINASELIYVCVGRTHNTNGGL